MAFTAAVLNAMIDAAATMGTYVSAHTADPGTSGASEVTGGSYARQQTTWGAAGNGIRIGTQVTIPIPAGTVVTHVGVWSAASGGLFREGAALSASQNFVTAANLLHTPTLSQISG